MDIASVLEKNGLDLTTVTASDGSGLVKLSVAYNELLETLTAESETQQAREKAIRDAMLKSHSFAGTNALIEVRALLAELIDENEDYLPGLVEAVQEMKQDLMVLRDYHVSAVARETKPEKVRDSSEVETRKQEASTLREAIVSVFTLMGRPESIEGFATKKNKENVVMPDLPRVPGGNTTGNVGRGAKIRQMQFELDGKKIPAGTLFYDLVRHHLCDFANGVVTKTTDVTDLIDKTGKSFAPDGYENRWTVEINGTTLSGWLPEQK